MLRIHHNKVRIIVKLFIDETNTFSNRGFFWRHSGSLFSLVSTYKYVQTLICTFEGAQQFSFLGKGPSLREIKVCIGTLHRAPQQKNIGQLRNSYGFPGLVPGRYVFYVVLSLRKTLLGSKCETINSFYHPMISLVPNSCVVTRTRKLFDLFCRW